MRDVLINLAITPVATEMEQQQTICQEDGKQNVQMYRILHQPTYLAWLEPLNSIAKMARVAIGG